MLPIIPVPAANAAILKEGKILLTQRASNIREGGKWCLPGGHVEQGETWLEAMTREVREEVGLEVRKSALLGVYSDPLLTVTPVPYYGNQLGQFVAIVFLVTEFEGNVVPNHEVEKFGWFSEVNIPSPMLRSHPIRVGDAFQYKGVPFVR